MTLPPLKPEDYQLKLFHEEPKTTHAIGLPHEHYERIYKMASQKRCGIVLKDKHNRQTRFYFHKGILFGRRYTDDGSIDTQPVLDIENLPEDKTKYNEIKETVRDKIRKDFPDYTEEEVDAYADIIEEGSMTVRRLAASGIPLLVAHKIVFSSLNSQNIDPVMVERWLTENDSTNSMDSRPTPTSQ